MGKSINTKRLAAPMLGVGSVLCRPCPSEAFGAGLQEASGRSVELGLKKPHMSVDLDGCSAAQNLESPWKHLHRFARGGKMLLGCWWHHPMGYPIAGGRERRECPNTAIMVCQLDVCLLNTSWSHVLNPENAPTVIACGQACGILS